jgi:hypothetical protein
MRGIGSDQRMILFPFPGGHVMVLSRQEMRKNQRKTSELPVSGLGLEPGVPEYEARMLLTRLQR